MYNLIIEVGSIVTFDIPDIYRATGVPAKVMKLNKMFKKLIILKNSLIGFLIKWKYDILKGKCLKALNGKTYSKEIIVSLTSYGRRVKNSIVYYTIVSLLNQTYKPSRIILWLDRSWNDQNIPKKIRDLKKYGLEIRYYDDIRSYKKLIPTLKENPDSIIITVDDDIIYSKYLIETLFKGYENDNNIQCTHASHPYDKDKNFLPYNKWQNVSCYYNNNEIVPIGAGGILYPPHSLSEEVLIEDKFMKLAPSADDLWFWVMAKRAGSNHSYTPLEHKNHSFDDIYQYFHKGSALTHSNAGKSQNDIQLKNIIKEFPIQKE